jgi:Uma2 family endonuclease
MYDLPSENPEEPGLPDEYHYLQPQLLSFTFCPPAYFPERVFSAGDMNLYYDVRHPLWYKRPDWFGVVGVPRLYEGTDLRRSYVIWQEGISPFVVVELLSPGTEEEDLGQTLPGAKKSPNKWEVYEQILRIPYYVLFDRYKNQLQVFTFAEGHYQPVELQEPRVWLSALELGLGVWQGEYRGIERSWLRWYDARGNWVPTDFERAEQERQRAEQERRRANRAEAELEALRRRLRESGIDPDAVSE